MSLYKDFLKDNGQGGDDQYFYSVDASGAGPDPNHQNGFSFGGYGQQQHPGHPGQLGQRPSLPPNMAPQQPSGLFRPPMHAGPDSGHYSTVPPPGRTAYPNQGGLMGGAGLGFPSNPGSGLSGRLPGSEPASYGRFGGPPGQFGGMHGLLRDDDVEDFPALPSKAADPLGGASASIGADAHPLPAGLFSKGQAPADGKDGRFGLGGLMETNRSTDKEAYTLALGMDLTTFGLNLNSAESLYLSFSSPFADSSTGSGGEPAYSIPQCYNMHPPALKTEHLSKFHLETLFYMFYQLPRDILQACAAQELYRRDWRYHAELRLWLKPRSPAELAQSHSAIQFVYFDAKAWEVRLFNLGAAQVRGNLKAGLVSEEDIRVKPPLPGSGIVTPGGTEPS